MSDVTHEINAVRRAVGSRVLEAGEVRSVIIARDYDGALEDLWDACTNPERIVRWFLPISGELRVGGQYRLEGNASGTIERCEPPGSFRATWEYGGNVSWIEVRLTPNEDGTTRFELEHIAPDDPEKWAEFGPGAVGVGWDLGLMGLAGYLGSGRGVEPHEAAAWSASEEGRRFMTTSSRKWCEAAIAAGDDPAKARAAAQRTTASYVGASPA